jgi:hypothetical protein
VLGAANVVNLSDKMGAKNGGFWGDLGQKKEGKKANLGLWKRETGPFLRAGGLKYRRRPIFGLDSGIMPDIPATPKVPLK